jgi:hypothetical protein
MAAITVKEKLVLVDSLQKQEGRCGGSGFLDSGIS